MTATLSNRITEHVDQFPGADVDVLADAVGAALLALRAQLADPDPAVVRQVAGMILDLEKTRLRHGAKTKPAPRVAETPVRRSAPAPVLPEPDNYEDEDDDLDLDDDPPPQDPPAVSAAVAALLECPKLRAKFPTIRAQLQTEFPRIDWSSDVTIAHFLVRVRTDQRNSESSRCGAPGGAVQRSHPSSPPIPTSTAEASHASDV